MDLQIVWMAWNWQVHFLFYFDFCIWAYGQLHYTVVEESEPLTIIGNVASDLGLSFEQISERRLHLGSEESRRYFSLRLESGDLLLNEKVDRENLCGFSSICLLPVELIIEKPLELFRLVIEILDINDNSPSFINSERLIKIPELAAPGLRFPLENAIDLDVGANAVTSYKLSPNKCFSLNVKQLKDGKLFPELVLENALDREEIGEYQLILTALDGGQPPKSGTAKITVQILDNNDNPPMFDKSVFKTSLLENIPFDSFLIKLNATDMDEGPNSEIEYSFDDHTSGKVRKLFSLDSVSGEIHVQGNIDFEETSFYEIYIRARDKGVPVMEGHCVIQVEIEDVNDNAPEVFVTSLEGSVPENTPIGTVVGLFNIFDRDSGKNGEVQIEIPQGLPFKFKSFENHYSLITDDILDRETTPQYTINMIVSDQGSPAMFAITVIVLNISDFNDNAPMFSHGSFNAYIYENNLPGDLICTVYASDADEGENSLLKFSITETYVSGSPISSFIYMNEHNGNIYAQRSFDYEQIQLLEIPVLVQDGGSPTLQSNITIHLFILDQNDNYPKILYPIFTRETNDHLKIRRSVSLGNLVTKVTAVDADSGYNAWLSYSILHTIDSSIFGISAHTGEIRIIQSLLEAEESTYTIFVLVKDNGELPLTSTATVVVSIEENVEDESPQSQDHQPDYNEQPDMTLYLIISLAAISVVSVVTFIVLTVKCLKMENSQFCRCLNEPEPNNFACQPQATLQLNKDGTLKYMEVKTIPRPSTQAYNTCFSPALERTDFTFLRPLDFPQLKDILNEDYDEDDDVSFSLNNEFSEVIQVRNH
ncbi:protocadherin gamma-C5-like [Bombina bombina]|uniref:protocadherin gamma-C5-like n=1 Tax=Bombina bombina TaxID=8345 RepID=UPI00235B2B6D|nr:protocadherin gamma-C5-like [Bombina bombina]